MQSVASPNLLRQLSPRDTVDQIASRRLKTNRQVQMLSNVQLTSYMKSIGLRPEGTAGVRSTRKAWEKQCFDRRTELIGKFGNTSETKTQERRQSRLAARRRRASAHTIGFSPSPSAPSLDDMMIPKLEINEKGGRGRKRRSASLATGRKRFGKSYSTPNPGEWFTASGGRRRQTKVPDPRQEAIASSGGGQQKAENGGDEKSSKADTDLESEKSSLSPKEQKGGSSATPAEGKKKLLKKRKIPEPTTESEKRGAVAREEILDGTVSEDPTAPMNVLSKIRKVKKKKSKRKDRNRSRSMPPKRIRGTMRDRHGRPVEYVLVPVGGPHGGPPMGRRGQRVDSSPRRDPGGASWLRGRAAPQKRTIGRGWNRSHPEAEAKENADGNATGDGKSKRKPRSMSLGAGQRRKKALVSESERKQAANRVHEVSGRQSRRNEPQQGRGGRHAESPGRRVTSRRVSAAARRVQEQQREQDKETANDVDSERRARERERTERPEEKVDGAPIPSRFMARKSRRTQRGRRQQERTGPNPIVPLPDPDANKDDDLPDGPSIVVPKDEGSSWAKDFEASKSREDKKSPGESTAKRKDFKLGSVADEDGDTAKKAKRRESPKSSEKKSNGSKGKKDEKVEEEINPGSVLAAIRKSRKGKKKRRRKQTA